MAVKAGRSADVLIVGAGIIGLNIAWQLTRCASRPSVCVLERGAGVGEGSTGASSAVCRHRYSLDDMVRLARDGITAYREWRAYTGLTQPRAAFHNDGVLWLTGENRDWAPRERARMENLGVNAEVMDDGALSARFPAFSPCVLAPDLDQGQPHDCRGGGLHFFEPDGGYMDPVDCAADLVEACRGAGVDLRFNARVTEIELTGGAVSAVALADGSRIETATVVNAAGPWCNPLLREAGLDLPWTLAPTRIQILHIDRPAALEGPIPVAVDMDAGIYFRTQNRGQQLVIGSTLEEDEQERADDPDRFDTLPADDFMLRKLHALHHRLPALPFRGRPRGYCGLYTVNLQDVHPLLGPTAVPGFHVANGFSGHGFKLAPAIGAMMARQLTGERVPFSTEVPASLFSVERAPIQLASHSVLA